MENGPSFMIRSTPRDPTLTRAAYRRPAPGPPGRPGLYAALELDRPLVAVDPRWTFRSGARPRPRAPVTPRRAPAPASRLPPRLDARTRRAGGAVTANARRACGEVAGAPAGRGGPCAGARTRCIRKFEIAKIQ